MIALNYIEKDRKVSVDGLIDVSFDFMGNSLNVMPTPVVANLVFDVSSGYSEALENLLDAISLRHTQLIDFNIRRINEDEIDIIEFTGKPVLWGTRLSDGSIVKVQVDING